MIEVYGSPGKESGDKQVFEALKYLPKGWLAYAQPKIVHKTEERYPDYVLLHREYGYIVLEVKDWLQVENPYADGCYVISNLRPRPEKEKSPIEQARDAAQLIHNKLVQVEELRNFSGKLDFAYSYAGILPKMNSNRITWLQGHWGEGHLLGGDDLIWDKVAERIQAIQFPVKRPPMTDRQFDAVRAVLDHANIAYDIRTGGFKGVYTVQQEELAKAPLDVAKAIEDPEAAQAQQLSFDIFGPDPAARKGELAGALTEEANKISSSKYVNLVRGFSGTGKTDVLVLRARYLYEKYPDFQILVTTFNKPLVEERLMLEFKGMDDRIRVCTFDQLAMAVFKQNTKMTPNPQTIPGLLTNLMESGTPNTVDLIKKYSVTFLSDEFLWMKEANLTERDTYLNTQREGRGKTTLVSLNRAAKNEVFDVFEEYQHRLELIRAMDWADFHTVTAGFVDAGKTPETLYDQILIDEAQHFAPSWIRVVKAHLKPEGYLFLCDDPSQSVYRFFSWQQKGINVLGRTRWLRKPYRTTRQIFDAGFALIKDNPLAKQLLNESHQDVLPKAEEDMRQGELPKVVEVASKSREKEYIEGKVKELLTKYLPAEIAVLHTEADIIKDYRTLLPGIKVDDLKRRTGMEYKVVFIPQLHRLFNNDEIGADYRKTEAEYQLAMYMAITRARELVYLFYSQKWPKALNPANDHFEWIKEQTTPPAAAQ